MAYGVATNNPFDLLGDDDDPVQVIPAAPVAEPKQVEAPKKQKEPKENKPVKAAEVEAPPATKGDSRKGGKGKGGGRGYPRDDADGEITPFQGRGGKGGKDRGKGKGGKGGYEGGKGGYEGGKGGYYGGGGGGGGDGEERRPRREFDRRSGSGKGGEIKRGGSGRGNWGSNTEEINSEKTTDAPTEGVLDGEKPTDAETPDGEDKAVDTEAPETPKEEEQDNEMTLEEYEKAMEAKKLEFKNKFAKSGGRKTDEAEYANMAKVEKADINEEDAYTVLAKSKANKAAADKTIKTKETVETNFHIPRDDGYSPRKGKGDGRKGGDRKGYGGRGERRGGKGQAPISISDTEAFPTLPGAKAK